MLKLNIFFLKGQNEIILPTKIALWKAQDVPNQKHKTFKTRLQFKNQIKEIR